MDIKRKIFPDSHQTAKRGSSQIRRWLFIIVGILFLLALNLLRPWGIGRLQSHPQPASNYPTALLKVQQWSRQNGSGVSAAGGIQFLTHHRKTERAIVLVHGYTNCPLQFKKLGEHFYALGYNVLIAPLPYHGLADRMTDAHSKLTAEALASYGDRVVDIARGLGNHVTMMGLSAGGCVTAWAAQNRSELDLAIVISPFLGYQEIPAVVTPAVSNFLRIWPNFYQWWEPASKERGGMPGCYPRYSSRALAEIMRLGFAVRKQANQKPPAAARIIMVTNANDSFVDPVPIKRLGYAWKHNGAKVETFQFAKELQLDHDLIDPNHPKARIDKVYPVLIRLVTQETE